jgi:hypothetical protein
MTIEDTLDPTTSTAQSTMRTSPSPSNYSINRVAPSVATSNAIDEMTDDQAKGSMRSLVMDRTPNITGLGSGTKFSVEDQISHYRELWRCHKALEDKLIDDKVLESADQRLQQYEGNPETWTEEKRPNFSCRPEAGVPIQSADVRIGHCVTTVSCALRRHFRSALVRDFHIKVQIGVGMAFDIKNKKKIQSQEKTLKGFVVQTVQVMMTNIGFQREISTIDQKCPYHLPPLVSLLCFTRNPGTVDHEGR